ncbi:hypothetical protein EM864_02750 [Stenotrophomonas acidaminiphila]|uniref:hypothetical protein n=1 Tax=Stenotrophomonas acidaminiphila TaxID=128780 RepID=UPI0024070439|nr:hypothetical protein [Stenotrophomonas acidaminiphila]MDF9440670.1 hypothetical protein [Stenotrophomonas acidaminiphila]
MTSLDQLTTLLDALEAKLPDLLAAYPADGDFWMAFAGEADAIEDRAGEHVGVVNQRISAMPAQHGRFLVGVEASP